MNYQHNPELIDKLAAEYVLGTLRHRARRRFERWHEKDEGVRQAVLRWQNKLHPMAHWISPVTPPASIWQKIETRLFNTRTSTPLNMWSKLGLWQLAAGLGLATSLALCVVLISQPPAIKFSAPSAAPQYVAVLSNEQHQPSIIVNYDASQHTLNLTQLAAGSIPPQKVLELWSIPEQGAPVSLGVLNNKKAVSVGLKSTHLALLQHSKALAISLEPTGGSPTGAPTGPVLYSGALVGKVAGT